MDEQRIRDLEVEVKALYQVLEQTYVRLIATQRIVRSEFGYDDERWRQQEIGQAERIGKAVFEDCFEKARRRAAGLVTDADGDLRVF